MFDASPATLSAKNVAAAPYFCSFGNSIRAFGQKTQGIGPKLAKLVVLYPGSSQMRVGILSHLSEVLLSLDFPLTIQIIDVMDSHTISTSLAPSTGLL